MGNCCKRNIKSDNISENFMRDVLFNLPIRKSSFTEIIELYNILAKDEIDKTLQDIGIEEKPIMITRGTLFNYIKGLIEFNKNKANQKIKKNPYKIFHEEIFNFEDKTQIGYDPEYYLLTFCLSLMKDEDDKFSDKIYRILQINSECTLTGFNKFIKLYLYINLYEFTKLVNLGFFKFNKSDKIIFDNYDINNDMINNCQILEKEVFTKINVDKLINKIKNKTEKLFKANENVGFTKQIKLDSSDISKIIDKFDYLDNFIKIRTYFYEKFKNL